jgi:hypothetical protein
MLRATVVFLMLVVAYPISYLVLLNPEVYCFTFSTTQCHRQISFRGFGESEDFLQVVYKPLLDLDRKWRPEYWKWSAGEGR